MVIINSSQYVISVCYEVIFNVLNMLEKLFGKELFSILLFMFFLAVFSGLFDAIRSMSKKFFLKILMFPIREQENFNKYADSVSKKPVINRIGLSSFHERKK